MKPTVGRIVLFTAEAGAYQGLDSVHAAIVNAVNADGTVNLSVLSGSVQFPVQLIKNVSYNENGPSWTWKWPAKDAAPAAAPAPTAPASE